MTTTRLLLAPLCAALLAAACTGESPKATPPAAAPAAAPASPPAADATGALGVVTLSPDALTRAGLAIETASERMHGERVTVPGMLALDETKTARIGSLQEGLLLETRAQVGDRVRRNQLIATMHGHAVHDAWAGYRKALAERRRARKAAAYASDQLARAQRLYEAKAVSLQERQRAELDQVSAKEQVDMAQAEVLRSIEELEHIGIRVANADVDEAPAETTESIPVFTPMAGVVLERLVTPGTTVTPGSLLYVVSDLSSLWAVAELDESHLSRVKVGQSVEVRVNAWPGEMFPGTITFIGDTVNPKTRRITVRARVDNPQGRLKPEMYASFLLGEGTTRQTLAVPSEAVQTINGRSVVFVGRAAQGFRAQPVTLGADFGGEVEVTDGLRAGDPVVTRGAFILKSELLKGATQGD